jgi:hypothetical protein
MNADHANKQAGEAAPTDSLSEEEIDCIATRYGTMTANGWLVRENLLYDFVGELIASSPGSTGRAEPAERAAFEAWGKSEWGDRSIPDPSDMVQVTKEDANNYCRILTALGMEEEGDPVAEVERLRAGAPDPLRPAPGWKLVPVEPTPEMIRAAASTPGMKAIDDSSAIMQLRGYPLDKKHFEAGSPLQQAWRAMLAAAPSSPADPLRTALELAKGAIEMLVHNIDPDLGHSDKERWDALGYGNEVLDKVYDALAALPSPLEKAAERDVHPAGLIDGTSSAGSPSNAGASGAPKRV